MVEDLLIHARRLVSPDGHILKDGWLLVRGTRILLFGEGRPELGRRISLIDAGDATILPGLIDAHLHLNGAHRRHLGTSADAAAMDRDMADVRTTLAELVGSGIAAVRDCGYPHHGIFALRRALRSHPEEAPDLVLCGRAIGTTGGHAPEITVQVDGPDAVRAAVQDEIRAGADWIKLMVTGGTATPNEEVSDVQMSGDEVKAAVMEAHRQGRKVCAHCSNTEGTHLAVDSGVDGIEHGIDLDQDAVQTMALNGVWLSPTLSCTRIEAEADAESGIPDYTRKKAARIADQQAESFRRALRAGVPIAAATDAGPSYFPLSVSSLVRELVQMAALGMAPGQVIKAATSDGARAIGIEQVAGSLVPGKRADVLVTPGDPSQDLTVLLHPLVVLRSGKIVRNAVGVARRLV